jgi:hypothetical protein
LKFQFSLECFACSSSTGRVFERCVRGPSGPKFPFGGGSIYPFGCRVPKERLAKGKSSYNINLLAVLALGDLASTFLVKVCVLDAHLQFLKLIRLGTHHFLFTHLPLVIDLKLSHFASELLFHARHVNGVNGRVEVSILESRSHLITDLIKLLTTSNHISNSFTGKFFEMLNLPPNFGFSPFKIGGKSPFTVKEAEVLDFVRVRSMVSAIMSLSLTEIS